MLDLDPVLEKLKQQIQDPDYIKSLARKLLLDNNHRIRLVLKPDTELAQAKDAAEKKRLADIKDALTEEQKQAIIASAEALKQRQEMEEDLNILPKVDSSDIPEESSFTEPTAREFKSIPITSYAAGTNGIAYQ